MVFRDRQGSTDKMGYPINSIIIPTRINASPPTLTAPRFEHRSPQDSLSPLSFGSGLCSQSSFSTSSGNSNNPEEGVMLYFSETVCVLTPSSSLPALDGDLESSNGDANGPARLSLLPAEPELQLVLHEGASPPLCTDSVGEG